MLAIHRTLSLAFASMLASSNAYATPQWSFTLEPGLGLRGDRERAFQLPVVFSGALDLSVLFGQTGSGDVGIGPELSIGTLAFDDLRLRVGPTLYAPIGSTLSLGVSAGGYLSTLSDQAHRGLSGALFLGGRSFDYHGAYGPTLGVRAGFDTSLDHDRHTAYTLALVIDAEYVSIPFLVLVSLLRGRPAFDSAKFTR